MASADNVFADTYLSSRGKGRSGSLESIGSVGRDTDIGNGIYRGEASINSLERDKELYEAGSTVDNINMSYGSGASTDSPKQVDRLSWATRSPGNTFGDVNNNDFAEIVSCEEDTENLLSVNEDIRLELSAIDLQYLENASIENVCDRDGKFSSCDFDFRVYPSNLQMVCKNHGGNFYRTEHSIQCHNTNTMESLYYQFDHYPSCFSAACEDTDAKRLLTNRIDFITRAMSEYLKMSCFADDDILRFANDASSIESSGSKILWYSTKVFFAVPFVLIYLK